MDSSSYFPEPVSVQVIDDEEQKWGEEHSWHAHRFSAVPVSAMISHPGAAHWYPRVIRLPHLIIRLHPGITTIMRKVPLAETDRVRREPLAPADDRAHALQAFLENMLVGNPGRWVGVVVFQEKPLRHGIDVLLPPLHGVGFGDAYQVGQR